MPYRGGSETREGGKPPTGRDLQAQATRKRLLETAIALMIERGYDGISIGEICKKAETSKANFYTHFTSKRDIVREILADVNLRMFGTLDIGASKPVFDQLWEYSRTYLNTIHDQGKDFTKAVLKIILDMDYSASDVYADKHGATVLEILRRGKIRGELPDDFEESSFARGLQTIFYGLMADWCLSPADDVLEEGRRLIRSYLEAGLPTNRVKNT